MIVGLDFGTATCRASAMGTAGPQPVRNRFDARRLPLYVTVGAPVPDSGADAAACFRFVGLKQKLGVDDYVLGPGGREPVATVLTSILAQVRDDLQSDAAGEIEGVVASVSGAFSERSRSAFRQALLRAGFPRVKLVNEATAAVLADGVKAGEQGTFLVYALGAGFFSATVLQVVQGVPQMLGVEGARDICGYACDEALARLLLQRAGEDADVWIDEGAPLRLQALAEPLRIGLSRRDQEEIDLDLPSITGTGAAVSLSITRADLEGTIEDLVRRTLTLSQQTLTQAGLSPAALTGGVMVGGLTRMPMVERLLRETFACPWRRVGEQAIAAGAAVIGQRLTEKDWTTDEPPQAATPAAPIRPRDDHAAAPEPAALGSWLPLFDKFVEAERLWGSDRSAALLAFRQGRSQVDQLFGNLLETQGKELLRAGRHLEAVDCLKSAHEASPNDHRIKHSYHFAINNLARHLYAAGDLAGSRNAIRVGLALDRKCEGCLKLATAIDAAIRDRRATRGKFGRRRGR